MANRRLDQLTALTAPDATDLFYVETEPGLLPRKINADDLLAWITANVGPVGSPYHQGLYVPITRHGATPGGAFDNTTAINDAVAEAVSIGAPGVVADFAPGQFWNFEGRVNMQGKDMIGFGPANTIFRCQDPGAGFDFTAFDAPGTYTGYTGHFKIDGNNVALRQMVIGKRVLCRFTNIQTWAADPNPASDSVCLLIASMQNSLLDTIWSGGGAVACRFDAGAANNVMAKSEISAAFKNMLEFRESGDPESPPGQFDYTLYNTVMDTILEGPNPSTECMVYASASALNVLRHCPISVNGDILGGGQPTGMGPVVLVEAEESAQASLIIEDCMMHGGSSTGASSTVAYHSELAGTFGAARIQLRGGSVGQVPLGASGNVVVESEPWFFSTVTTKWSTAGITTVIPRSEQTVRRYVLMQGGPTAITEAGQVVGEANTRYFEQVSGTRVYGDGTASTDSSFGRIGAGHIGAITGNIGAINSAWNQPHLQLGTFHLWVDATGALRIKNGAPASDLDGALV